MDHQNQIIIRLCQRLGELRGWAVYKRLPNGKRGGMVGYVETRGAETKPWHLMRNRGHKGRHIYVEV